MKKIETDVLVVGSGAAGLRAAIEAAKEKLDVLLVSKSPTGFGSCSIYSGGGFLAPINGMTAEDHFRLTVTTGKSLSNQQVVERLTSDASDRIQELRKFGVTVQKGTYMGPSGHYYVSGPRVMEGAGFIQPLTKYAQMVGVKTLDRIVILDLLGEYVITGAIGFNIQIQEPVGIAAKAVVLAAGGAGQVFRRNDNPAHITGDGYALAFRRGLSMLDMEFVQCYPFGLSEDGYPFCLPVPAWVLERGACRNLLGEDITCKYGLDAMRYNSLDRDLWTRAIGKEIYEGRGDQEAVLLDLTRFYEDLKTDALLSYLSTPRGKLSITERPIRVCPVVHTFLGGILIKEDCQTELPGLYAAGEVAGGIHGANRIGGNALTECIVFGAIAGRSAARYAKAVSRCEIDLAEANLRFEAFETPLKAPANPDGRPKPIKARIQALMWKEVGMVRNAESLQRSEEGLRALEEDSLVRLNVRNPREQMEAFEVLNMLIVAKLVTQAAKLRTESRGTHYRSDYPDQDDSSWLKNILVKAKGGRIETALRPVVATRLLPD